MKSIKAFTLIELLVVVSIIALLVSILLPALGKARNQARMTVDLVGIRQIGTSAALYQCEHNNCVPVILNRWAMSDFIGAENAFLSVALRAYSPQTRSWPSDLISPSLAWDNITYETYVKKYLPEFYVCPFLRDTQKTAPVFSLTGSANNLLTSGVPVYFWSTKGYRECYEPGMWELKAANPSNPPNTNYLLGFPHGWAKYGALPWNRANEMGLNHFIPADAEKIKANPSKWDRTSIRRVGTGPSDVTVLMCTAGEHDHWANSSTQTNGLGIYERGSHKRGKTGGTNVLFCDGHADWVPGDQVGWR